MLFHIAVASVALGSVSALSSYPNVSTSTEVVTAYTTYCPEPTSFTEGNQTYVVTEPTTLTVTDCPCTRTHTWTTLTSSVCLSGTGSAGSSAPIPVSASPSVSAQNTTAPPLSNGAARAGLSLAAVGAAVLLL